MELGNDTHHVSMDDVYTSYIKHCARQNADHLKLEAFAKVVGAIFMLPVNNKSRIRGVKWKAGLNPKQSLAAKFKLNHLEAVSTGDDVSSMDASSQRGSDVDSSNGMDDDSESRAGMDDDAAMDAFFGDDSTPAPQPPTPKPIPTLYIEHEPDDVVTRHAKALYSDDLTVGTSGKVQAFKSQFPSHQTLPDINDTVFYSAVILRNFAKSAANVAILTPWEHDLVVASTCPPLSVYAAAILTELERSSM